MKASAIDFSPAGPGLLAGAHILAIDDDPAMRTLVADYLSGNDLRVTAVATGAEMAQALAQHAIDWSCSTCALRERTAWSWRASSGSRRDPDHHRHRQAGRSRPGDGTRARRRRLRHQALQPARAPRPHPRVLRRHQTAARDPDGARRQAARLSLCRLGAQPPQSPAHLARGSPRRAHQWRA